MKFLPLLISVALGAGPLGAATTSLPGNNFAIDGPVTFSVSVAGGAFVFGWSDESGVFSAANPSLQLATGRSFTFTRTDSGHPLALTYDSLPVIYESDAVRRGTTTSADLVAAMLPLSDPAVSGENPTDSTVAPVLLSTAGMSPGERFYYTSTVLGETEMTGDITVAVPEPRALPLAALGLGLLLRRRA